MVPLYVTFDYIFSYGVLAAIALWIFSRIRKKAAFTQLPKDGPMKVSISTNYVQNPIGYTNHYLIIDVVISQADWLALDKAGVTQQRILQYRSSASKPEDPEGWMDFCVKHLSHKSSLGFNDVVQLEEAKDKLIQALHGLRAAIDHTKEGPSSEKFEI
jgi:hypothetical protein